MDDDETLVIDQTQRNHPFLAVVLSVIAAGEHLTLEDQRCIQEINSTLFDDLLTLCFIPFEFHLNYSSRSIFSS